VSQAASFLAKISPKSEIQKSKSKSSEFWIFQSPEARRKIVKIVVFLHLVFNV